MIFSLTVLLLSIYSRKILALVSLEASVISFVIDTNWRQSECPPGEDFFHHHIQGKKRFNISGLAYMKNVHTTFSEKQYRKYNCLFVFSNIHTPNHTFLYALQKVGKYTYQNTYGYF